MVNHDKIYVLNDFFIKNLDVYALMEPL